MKHILLKSLFLGLLFFVATGYSQYKLDLNTIKSECGILNDIDLETATNNSIDQIKLMTQVNVTKLQGRNPGSVASNCMFASLDKVDSLTKKEIKLVQYISEKCWANKGFDQLFFRKNMDHLAKIRDTSFLQYADFITSCQPKSKMKFNAAKFDINNFDKSTKNLTEMDREMIRLMYGFLFKPSSVETNDFERQMATFRLLQLEYAVLQYLISEHYLVSETINIDVQQLIYSTLKTENVKNIAFKEQVRLDSLKKAQEQMRIDSLAEAAKNRTYHVVAVGDMMLGTNFPNDSYLPPANVKLLDPVKKYLQGADCTFGNLEGTVLNEGGDVKSCSDPSICYAFRMPEKYVDEIKEAGFDLISVANNHVGDFGESGRANTTKVLLEKGFCFSGLLSRPWDTLTINGLKYGLVSFAPNTGTVRIENYPEAIRLVKELDKMVDVVVVSFHGGAEGSKHQHVTKNTEIFYGENRGNVYEFAHLMIDNGADLVFGHGPHVTRAIDIYKDRFITYSMGNFCTYHRFNLSGVSGIAPMFDIEIDGNGKFIKGKVISTKQLGEGGPLIDKSKTALRLIKELTASDLPELKIKWEGDYFTID